MGEVCPKANNDKEPAVLTISKLRNPYVMKWSLWVIIIITIPSFVLFYGFGAPGSGEVDFGPVVTVHTDDGKVELDRTDLRRMEESAANYYTQLASPFVDPQQLRQLTPTIQNALQSIEVARFAVAEIALEQRLQREGIRVTDTQVSQYLRDSGMTREQLTQMLAASRMSELEYAQRVRASLKNQIAQDTVRRIARPSLLELWNEYRINEEIIDTAYVPIPVATQVDITFTEEEIRGRYEELAAERAPSLIDPPKRLYEFVALSVPRRNPLPVSDAELREAYEALDPNDPAYFDLGGAQVRHILLAGTPADKNDADTTARIAELRAELTGGANFEELANQYSQDLRNLEFIDENTSPTLRGGVLPARIRDTATHRWAWGDEYVEYATSAPLATVSDPIWTPQGYAIVEVMGRRPAGMRPLSEVEADLRAQITEKERTRIEEERTAQIAANLEKMRAAAASQTTLEGVAREVGSTVQATSPTLVSSTFIRGIGNLSNERESLELMRVNRMSRPLQTNDGTVAVLMVTEEIDERIFPFDEARSRVEGQMRREHAAREARKQADELATRVRNGEAFADAATDLGLTPLELEPFARATPPQELQGSPQLSRLLLSTAAGEIAIGEVGVAPFISSYIVVQVQSVDTPTKEEFLSEGVAELEQQMLVTRQLGYIEEFRRAASDELRAEFNENVFGNTEERESTRRNRSTQ